MYNFLYSFIILLITSIFPLLSGIYNEYVMAVPNPSSVSESKDNMLENNPFTPKYSIGRYLTNIVRLII